MYGRGVGFLTCFRVQSAGIFVHTHFLSTNVRHIFAVIHVQTTYQIDIRLIDSESQISGGVILPRLIKTNLSFIFKWCR